MNASRPPFLLALLAAALLIVAGASGQTVVSVPFGADHGDMLVGPAAGPVPLTSTSLVVGTEGLDGTPLTADDQLVLVSRLDGTPVLTPFTTPGLSGWGGPMARLSGSLVAAVSPGPDGDFTTADDEVLLLAVDGTLTSLPIAGLRDQRFSVPTLLEPKVAVLATAGPDLSWNTADDLVVMITDLGFANTLTELPAPGLYTSGRSVPVPLSPDSFLISSTGADLAYGTADDEVFLFTDLLGTPTRTDIAVPSIFRTGPGQAVVLSPTRAVVASEGPDSMDATEDDELWLLDDLGGANTTTAIPVPSIQNYGAGQPTVVSPTEVLVATEGADSSYATSDDSLWLLTGLGGVVDATEIVVGALDEDGQCRPVMMKDKVCVLPTFGPDNLVNTADDQLVILSLEGAVPEIRRLHAPGLGQGSASTFVPISTSAGVFLCGGPDGALDSGTPDDVLVLVTDLHGWPAMQTTPVGLVTEQYSRQWMPTLLGDGRVVVPDAGVDLEIGSGADDALRVIEGLPQVDRLDVLSAKLVFNPAKPDKPAKMTVKAALTLEDPASFGAADLVVELGYTVQRIPADALIQKKSAWVYKDKQGIDGFVRSLKYVPKKGVLQIKAKGEGTGVDLTPAEHLVIGLQLGTRVLANDLPALQTKKGLQYKAPKG